MTTNIIIVRRKSLNVDANDEESCLHIHLCLLQTTCYKYKQVPPPPPTPHTQITLVLECKCTAEHSLNILFIVTGQLLFRKQLPYMIIVFTNSSRSL